MPWELLDKEPSYRKKYFTPDAEGYGWITVPLDGPLDEITVEDARIMDLEWAELTKRVDVN